MRPIALLASGSTCALSILACGNLGQPEEVAEEPSAPACDLTFQTLADKTFVRQVKGADGKTDELDALARAHFFTDGDKVKVKYTVRSLTDVYDYTCVENEKEITCWEDNPDAKDYCRSLIANKGECTPEGIVEITGLPLDVAQKAHAELTAELKKLPPKEIEDMKTYFGSPNNQLRGILHVKIRSDECRLTMTDNYQTYSFGQIREMQNVVGSAKFVKSEKEYVFEHCKDDQSLVALKEAGGWAKPGEHEARRKVGETIPFRNVSSDHQRATGGCAYTVDNFVQYEPVGKGAAVGTDDKGRLDWSFTASFPAKGKYIVHQYRYKACNGGAPERVGVHCNGVVVE